jgi:hypothetical protein
MLSPFRQWTPSSSRLAPPSDYLPYNLSIIVHNPHAMTRFAPLSKTESTHAPLAYYFTLTCWRHFASRLAGLKIFLFSAAGSEPQRSPARLGNTLNPFAHGDPSYLTFIGNSLLTARGPRLLWQAARYPDLADKAIANRRPLEPNPCRDIAIPGMTAEEVQTYLLIIGSTGQGRSLGQAFFCSDSDLLASLSQPPRSAPPVDQLEHISSWPIGADESLDGCHPLIAMAYFERLAEAELCMRADPSAFAQAAHDLGLDLALASHNASRYGWNPQWLDGFELSLFARRRTPQLLLLAKKIAHAHQERRALSGHACPAQTLLDLDHPKLSAARL